MEERMTAGDEAFQRHLAEGHADTYLADIAHATEFRQALLAGVAVSREPASRE